MKSPGLLPIVLLALLPSLTQAQPSSPSPPAAMAPVEQYLIADRREEIALARSAAPASISADAEVLVLDRHGYQSAVKGKNGFVCFVERAWAAGFDDADFWNPRLRAPNCFNAPAARTVLPQYLQRTEWALAGATQAQLLEKAKSAYGSGRFVNPEAGSMSFMLSKLGHIGDGAPGPWLPHVMFFVPRGQALSYGAGLQASPVMGADGGAFEPTVLFIPVPRWSDGSASPDSEHHPHGQ